MSRHWMMWWATIVAVVVWCALPGEALADSFTVTSSTDASFSGPPGGTVFCVTPQPSGTTCTLRAAIQEANALGGSHTITLPARTYTLAQTGDDDTALNGDLDITANITITGAGAATTIVQACNVSANPDCPGIDRVFDVRPGGTLTMSGVTVRKGTTTTNGGGIQNRGTLALANIVLDANSASGQGGGIEHNGLAATLTNVSVANNQATFGAGIDSLSPSLTLTNVTLSGNIAGNVGGGLYQTGIGSPSATLTNVTIAGNSAFASGGGIMTTAGTLSLSNTIVANNVLTGGRINNCSGPVSLNSLGHNLVFPGAGCSLNAVGDQINRDPILGPLQVNGGQLPTHALLPGSFAIEGGNPLTPLDGQSGRCAAADARGLARPADGNLNGSGRCDIGAYELASFTVTSTIDADDASPGNFACAISTPGPCTLRAAIREANALGGAAIGLPANHFTLLRNGTDDTAQNGDLDITGGIIIQGAGPANTIVQACDADADPTCPGIDRVFDVQSGGSLAMSGVTVRNGTTSGFGGGFRALGDLSLTNVVVDSNVANVGGGIQAITGPTISLFNVTVSHNRATTAGGGISSGSAALSLTNVTISGNTVNSAFGGGLDLAAASSVATLANVTVAGNTAVGGAAGIEGVTGSNVVLRNSIVANNPPTPGGSGNCGGTGTFTSQGFNLVFPSIGCGVTQTGDVQNQDPKLGPLADHSGGTPTMALLAGSAAIDAGNTVTPGTGGTSCTGVDQRGISRLQDGNLDGTARCDIGSFEARLTDLCAQRPPVQLAVTRNGTGGLNVTVTAGLGKVTELDFHNSGSSHVPNTNARIDIAGSSSFGTEFHFHRSSPQVSEQLTVSPLDATKPITVPLDAFDACGAWPTFVGTGPNGGGGAGSAPTPVSAPSIRSSASGAPPAPGEACAWFPSHAAAQAYLRANPTDPLNLDRNRNGIACEGADGAGFMNAPLDHVPVPRPSP